MAALPELRQVAFISGTLINTSDVANINDENDATFIDSQSGNNVDGQWRYSLDDTPDDFASMDMYTIHLRALLSFTGDDTWNIRAYIADSAGNAISSIPAYQTVSADAAAEFTFTPSLPTVNDKASWDDAHIIIDYQNIKNKASDGNVIRITRSGITGTYTASVAGTYTGSIDQTLPSLTHSASGSFAPPVDTGNITSGLPSLSQSASGSFASSTGSTGDITSGLPSLTQSASGSFTESTGTAGGYSAKALELGATVVYAENITTSQWNDESPNAKHLAITATEATLVVEGPGDGLPNGLALGGSTDRAGHADDPVFQFTGNHTFVFWVQRSASVQDQWAQYFGKGDNPSYMIRQWDTDDNSIMYHLRGAVDTEYVQLPINTLPVDAWAMVIARYDGTNMLLRVLDITGTVINEVSVNKGVLDFDPGAQAFGLGAQNDTGTNWRREIRARMAGAAIFGSVALTDQQILDLHTAAITAPSAGNTAESILPAFTQSASGSVAAPVDTGDITSGLPSLTQSASGSFAKPSDVGDITSTLPSLTQSAEGTVTKPVYTGSIESALPSFAQSASGSVSDPVDVGDITSVLPSFTQTASGTVTVPAGSGDITSVLPAFQQSASGSFAEPVDVGDITSTLPALTQQASGSVEKPVYTGEATSTIPSLQQSASGSVSDPVNAGDIVSGLPSLQQSATGSVTVPTDTGDITSTLPAFEQSATATFAPPTDTGSITSTLPALQQSASGSFAEEVIVDVADPGYLYVHAVTEDQLVDIAEPANKQSYTIEVPADDMYLDVAASSEQLVTIEGTPSRAFNIHEADANKVEI